jgi:hypothetical protein
MTFARDSEDNIFALMEEAANRQVRHPRAGGDPSF